MPVSSLTSRNAATSRVSPASSFPLGNDQSSCTGRCTTTIWRCPLWRRTTSPPAAWTTSVWEGSSAVIDRRATGLQVTGAPPPRRGNARAPGNRFTSRSSVSAMSESKADEVDDHDPVEIEWQFDALDLRLWSGGLATLPTLAIETVDGGTITALARPRGASSTPIETATIGGWPVPASSCAPDAAARHDEVTLKDNRPAQGNGLRQRLESPKSCPRPVWTRWATTDRSGARLRAIVGTRRLREVLQVRTRRRPSRCGSVASMWRRSRSTTPMIVVGTGQRPCSCDGSKSRCFPTGSMRWSRLWSNCA